MTRVNEDLAGCKINIRLLPPELDEGQFRASIPPKFGDLISYFNYVPGVYHANKPKGNHHPLALLQFKNKVAAAEFIQSYHGHGFVNDRKEQYNAVCCYAPNQRPGNFAAEKLEVDVKKARTASKGRGKRDKASQDATGDKARLVYLSKKYAWNRASTSDEELKSEGVLNGYFLKYDERRIKGSLVWRYFAGVVLSESDKEKQRAEKMAIKDLNLLPKVADMEKNVSTDMSRTPLLEYFRKLKKDKKIGKDAKGRGRRDRGRVDEDYSREPAKSSSKSLKREEKKRAERVRTYCGECGIRRRCDWMDGTFYCRKCLDEWDEDWESSGDKKKKTSGKEDYKSEKDKGGSKSKKKDEDDWEGDWWEKEKTRKKRKDQRRQERRRAEREEKREKKAEEKGSVKKKLKEDKKPSESSRREEKRESEKDGSKDPSADKSSESKDSKSEKKKKCVDCGWKHNLEPDENGALYCRSCWREYKRKK